jgi:hypothetical protein
MKQQFWHIGAAIVGVVLITPGRQLTALVAAAGPTTTSSYKYVIGKPRLIGITDGAEAERRALQRLLQSQPIEVAIGDACDNKECDLVSIVETDEHVFQVDFYPSAAERQNKDHLEKETRRQPYPTPFLIWQQGSREIASLISRHNLVHVSSPQKNTQRNSARACLPCLDLRASCRMNPGRRRRLRHLRRRSAVA